MSPRACGMREVQTGTSCTFSKELTVLAVSVIVNRTADLPKRLRVPFPCSANV